MNESLKRGLAGLALGLGLFGIEIEATTKASVRGLWLKKLN